MAAVRIVADLLAEGAASWLSQDQLAFRCDGASARFQA